MSEGSPQPKYVWPPNQKKPEGEKPNRAHAHEVLGLSEAEARIAIKVQRKRDSLIEKHHPGNTGEGTMEAVKTIQAATEEILARLRENAKDKPLNAQKISPQEPQFLSDMAHSEDAEEALNDAASRQLYRGRIFNEITKDPTDRTFENLALNFLEEDFNLNKTGRAYNFILRGISNKHVWNTLALLNNESEQKNTEQEKVEFVFSLIKQNLLKREHLMMLWEVNKREYIEFQRRFREELAPKLQERFLNGVETLRKKGLMPLSNEDIQNVLNRTAVELSSTDGEDEDVAGTYDQSNFVITIGNEYFEKFSSFELLLRSPQIEKIYAHEALHALSAKMVVRSRESEKTSIRRMGFRIEATEKEGGMPRFEWLNEGMTEYLNEEYHDAASNVYAYEKMLLKYLMEKGKKPIPKELFANAYFENHEPSTDGNETIPHWRAWRKAINESFGSKFLIELDKAVQKFGIRAVVEKLTNAKKEDTPAWEDDSFFETDEASDNEGHEHKDDKHGEKHDGHAHDDHEHGDHDHDDHEHDDHGSHHAESHGSHGGHGEKRNGLFGSWLSFFGTIFSSFGEVAKGIGSIGRGKGGGGGGGGGGVHHDHH